MSKTKKALELPIYQPRRWGAPVEQKELTRPWFGLDTERDAKTGHFVCGYAWSPDRTIKFQRLTDLPGGVYWVWNLGYDLEAMMRDLSIDEKREEGWAMRSDGAGFRFGDAKCRYYKGKSFSFDVPGTRRLFVEASTFFNRISLKKAAKIVGERKGEVDASKMSWRRYRDSKTYATQVDAYCLLDAKIALELVEKVAAGLLLLKPKPIPIGRTPGSTARRFISQLPSFPKVIWSTQRPFLRSYCGGRFEVVKRGYFEKASQYDIVSAYPWALSKCPFLTEDAYNKFSTRVSDNALYGAYEVSFKCDSYFGIAPAWKGNTRVFSAKEKRVWLSKPELELIHDWGGDYKITQGVEVFDENATDDWARVIGPLFQQKQEKKDAPEGLAAKVVLNSLYGGMIQLIPKTGEWVPIAEAVNPIDFAGELALEAPDKAFEGGHYYAPLYAATLTSLVRRKVLEACAEIGAENVVGSHTDSILCIDGGPKLGLDLGDWSLKPDETDQELVIIKSGMYALGGKVKGRGIHKATKEILWAEKQERQYRVSMNTARKFTDVSLIKSREVKNNIGWELKRVWESELTAKRVLNHENIDSEPLRDVLPD